MSTPTPRTDEARRIDNGDTRPLLDEMETLERELAHERAKVKALRSALQNLVDEQNGAPLETSRGHWQVAMDDAGLALATAADALR